MLKNAFSLLNNDIEKGAVNVNQPEDDVFHDLKLVSHSRLEYMLSFALSICCSTLYIIYLKVVSIVQLHIWQRQLLMNY